jgi:hypothetical protein
MHFCPVEAMLILSGIPFVLELCRRCGRFFFRTFAKGKHTCGS